MPLDPRKTKLVKRVAGPAGFWAAALDPEGGRLYCGATDSAIHVYEAGLATDSSIARLAGHRSYVTAVAWARQPKILISGGFDRVIHGWRPGEAGVRVPSGHGPVWTASAGALVNQLAVAPDGEHAASAQDDLTVRLWETRTGRLVRTLSGDHEPRTVLGRNSTLYAVAFSPDGKLVASGDRVGGICVRETETGKLAHRLRADALYSQGLFGVRKDSSEYDWGGVRSLAFSPDGRLLFAGGMGPADQNSAGLDGLMKIEVFDLQAGKPLLGFLLEKCKGVLSRMAVHPEGRWLAAAGGGGGAGAGGSGTLCLWEFAARDGEGKSVPPRLFPSAMVIRDLAFSADGRQALLVGMEKDVTAGRIEVWDLG